MGPTPTAARTSKKRFEPLWGGLSSPQTPHHGAQHRTLRRVRRLVVGEQQERGGSGWEGQGGDGMVGSDRILK